MNDVKRRVILDSKFHFSIFQMYLKEYYRLTPFRFTAHKEVDIYTQLITYIFERFSSNIMHTLSEVGEINLAYFSLPDDKIPEFISYMTTAKNEIALMLARDLNFYGIVGSGLILSDSVYFYETNPLFHTLIID